MSAPDLHHSVRAHIVTPRTAAGRIERGLALRHQLARHSDPASTELLQELDRDALAEGLLERIIAERRRALRALAKGSPQYAAACLALAHAPLNPALQRAKALLAGPRLTFRKDGFRIGHSAVVFVNVKNDDMPWLETTVAPEVVRLLATVLRARHGLVVPALRVFDAVPSHMQGRGELADLVHVGRAGISTACAPAEKQPRADALARIAQRIESEVDETNMRWVPDGIALWRAALACGYRPQASGVRACAELLNIRAAGLSKRDVALVAEAVAARRELLARVEADQDADAGDLGTQRGHLAIALLFEDAPGARREARTLLRAALPTLVPSAHPQWVLLAEVQIELLEEAGAHSEAQALKGQVAFTKTLFYRFIVRVMGFLRMLVWLLRRP